MALTMASVSIPDSNPLRREEDVDVVDMVEFVELVELLIINARTFPLQ